VLVSVTHLIYSIMEYLALSPLIISSWENRQNLHVFNLWPVLYHTKKNSCGNPTLETLSVEIYTSQRDYPKSTCFYFVAIDVSQQKTAVLSNLMWVGPETEVAFRVHNVENVP
jgi:hypothetical protein